MENGAASYDEYFMLNFHIRDVKPMPFDVKKTHKKFLLKFAIFFVNHPLGIKIVSVLPELQWWLSICCSINTTHLFCRYHHQVKVPGGEGTCNETSNARATLSPHSVLIAARSCFIRTQNFFATQIWVCWMNFVNILDYPLDSR